MEQICATTDPQEVIVGDNALSAVYRVTHLCDYCYSYEVTVQDNAICNE